MRDDYWREQIVVLFTRQFEVLLQRISRYEAILGQQQKRFVIAKTRFDGDEAVVITPRRIVSLKCAAAERFHMLLALGAGDTARAILARHAGSSPSRPAAGDSWASQRPA